MRIQRRILCVDDHIDTCNLIATILEPQQVILAHTKADALRKARAERFSLYLLDYHLPDGTGFELCSLIRVFDSSTPIIFVTSSKRLTKSHVTAVGAQALVAKSDLPDGLVSAVSSIFNQDPKFGETKSLCFYSLLTGFQLTELLVKSSETEYLVMTRSTPQRWKLKRAVW